MNSGSGVAAVELDAQGPNYCIGGYGGEGAGGSVSIGQAYRFLSTDVADVMIAGGSEACLTQCVVAGFNKLSDMQCNEVDNMCKAFDKTSKGYALGEAAGLLVLETEEHAKARGAKILGRLMGASITSDGFHMVAPDPNGERAGYAMTRAIQLAGLKPTDIDHVNAHATGTSVGDVAEGKAINNAMGGHYPEVFAPKSALGHSVGAVGAVESILTLMALRDGVIPATFNFKNLDPEIDLDVVAGEPRTGALQYAINNSF